MTNEVVLSRKKVIMLQRVITVSSLILSFICAAAIICGMIPFYQRGATAYSVVFSAFEIFGIFTKNLWYCLFSVVFAVIYAVMAINSLRSSLYLVKHVSKQVRANYESEQTRKVMNSSVSCFNSNFVRIVILMAISYMVDAFKLDIYRLSLLVFLAVINVLVNFLKLLYLKRNLSESIFAPISSGVILFALFVFLFNIFDVQLSSTIKQISNTVLMLGVGDITVEYIVGAIALQIIFPIIQFVVICDLLNAYNNSRYYIQFNLQYIENTKKMAIRTIVAVVILAFIQAYAENSTDPDDIINILLTHIELILLIVSVYFASRNSHISVPDVPYLPDEDGESEDNSAKSAT